MTSRGDADGEDGSVGRQREIKKTETVKVSAADRRSDRSSEKHSKIK